LIQPSATLLTGSPHEERGHGVRTLEIPDRRSGQKWKRAALPAGARQAESQTPTTLRNRRLPPGIPGCHCVQSHESNDMQEDHRELIRLALPSLLFVDQFQI